MANANDIVAVLNDDQDDDWTYKVCSKTGNILAYDEDGHFMGKLN